MVQLFKIRYTSKFLFGGLGVLGYGLIGAGNYVWSCTVTGKSEFEIGAVAAILGGNVRVGLEDNLFLAKGVLARSNAELAAKMARICGEFGKEIATSAETRQMLCL